MNILGISCFYHDSAACLVQDGDITAAAQEERFTRVKHDQEFPSNAIGYCLEAGGIRPEDLDLVCYYEKPLLKFERIIETSLSYAPQGIRPFIKAMPVWLKNRLFIPNLIKKEIGYSGKLIFCPHHEVHAASAFYPSPFKEAAILTIDGVGEWATTSYGTGSGGDFRLIGEIKFPHSLGLLYSAFTYYTGFRVNSAEYKVMGLAPYGKPAYAGLILDKLMDLKEDGSFRLNMDYFNYCTGLTMTGPKFHELFGGPPRAPESEVTQKEMDIAASIQSVTEEVMLRLARHVKKATGEKNLCMSGGVALNCVANGKILRERIFDDIWVQPAAGDAGGALGAALIGWHKYLGSERVPVEPDSQKGSLLGPAYDDRVIEDYLRSAGAAYTRLDMEELLRTAAGLIGDGKVIGWFQGRMEYGPRALGNRSIIGDARSSTMKSTINLKIKFRESFRPFAPSVLQERSHEFFELGRPSPYMLLVADVVEGKRTAARPEDEGLRGIDLLNAVRSEVPAITHIDYSARIQTVSGEINPVYYNLIKSFERLTGCPVIINTSFNVRGEPIVCNPDDAYRCFMRTGMDYLFMGSFMLDKKEQPPFEDRSDTGNTRMTDAPKAKLREFGLVVGVVLLALSAFFFYKHNPNYVYYGVIGLTLAVLGLVSPGALRLPHRWWMKLASGLAWVNTRLLLLIIFYLCFTPIRLVAVLTGKRFIDKSFDKEQASYWQECAPHPSGREGYERIF